ncbi:MAG: efflux RND transporter permease subunit [Myxococcota bacterium]
MSGKDPTAEALAWRGPIPWMARNPVAANLLMICLIAGGLFMAWRIKQEVFPAFDLDLVLVNVVYPGASPAEIEQGVVLAVEEAVRGLDGVKETRSTVNESVAVVSVELLLNADPSRALSDVKSAVDRITSFPVDIERPVISLATLRRNVISLVIYGDLDELTLRRLAEDARDELLDDERVTIAELGAVRPYEISIEVPQENLRRYNLTLEGIARRIREASVEVPGGGVKTPKGEVLLRTTERRDTGSEFEEISILSRPDGSNVKVRDLATVIDGFRETDQEALFNGKPAAMVTLFRVGDETPTEVAAAAHEYVAKRRKTLPEGIQLATWADRSEIYRDRINLLLRNAFLGLTLVLLCLGLFMQLRLAFWVTMGIPISFIGAFIFMPTVDVSLNMISLFAFIIALGIVVDDAIVVGEAIFQRREQGMAYLPAAIAGVRDVAAPVIFAVLTTIIAFTPLLFVPGTSGKFFRNIPLVVIILFSLSLVEALFILPAHLAHGNPNPPTGGVTGFIRRQEELFGRFVQWMIHRVYVPAMGPAMRQRYISVGVCAAILILTFGFVASGRIEVTFMPKIDSDRVVATVEMPFGTAVDNTREVSKRLMRTASETLERTGGEDAISRGIFAQIGGTTGGFSSHSGSGSKSGGHVAQVTVYLVPSDQREISGRGFSQAWRQAVGEIAGAETLTFRYSTGPGGDAPINLELSHRDFHVLEQAGARLAAALGGYDGVKDIDDGFAPGKEQLDFRLSADARSLGLTEQEMARQVRAAFFGVEATRQQRGRDEVRAYVRLPRAERSSEYGVEELLLRTPAGGEIPLGSAASVTRGRSYTKISRINGRRVISVTADVERGKANANKVVASIEADVMPGVLADFPGLTYAPGGSQKRQAETMDALRYGFSFALVAMYALLAVAFRSYIQPAIIMSAIPFGLVGAVIGHVVMGFDLSLISMMGIVALSGIVVNDSLILIVAINRLRDEGIATGEAVLQGAVSRFRPVMLTSLTTFFGLMPMILEPSMQARFLIPMAISLGFGVLFATFITLLIVPIAYLILDDLSDFVGAMREGHGPESDWRPAPRS